MSTIKHTDFLTNKACMEACTGSMPTIRDTDDPDSKLFVYNSFEYADFDFDIDNVWVIDEVVSIHPLLPSSEAKFKPNHKSNVRLQLMRVRKENPSLLPGCFVPVSTTRVSEINDKLFRIFFICQGHTTTCTTLLEISCTAESKYYTSFGYVTIHGHFDKFPCVHPYCVKFGWLESDDAKQKLARKTARKAQCDKELELTSQNYWFESNHVCYILSETC